MKRIICVIIGMILLSLSACSPITPTVSLPQDNAEPDASVSSAGETEAPAPEPTEEIIDAHFQIIVRGYGRNDVQYLEETATVDGNRITSHYTYDSSDHTVVREYNPNGFAGVFESPMHTGNSMDRGDIECSLMKCLGNVLKYEYRKEDGTSGGREFTFSGNTVRETYYTDGEVDYYYEYKIEEHGFELGGQGFNADGTPSTDPFEDILDHDASGNVTRTSWINSKGEQVTSFEYEYDSSNRMIKAKKYSGDHVDSYHTFEYDGNGNMIKVSYFGGSDDVCMYTYNYDYDSSDRLIKMTEIYMEYDRVEKYYTYEYIE